MVKPKCKYEKYPKCDMQPKTRPTDCLYFLWLTKKHEADRPTCINKDKKKDDEICPGKVSRKARGIGKPARLKAELLI